MISAEIETSRDAEGSITNPVEESEGGGDIQGDGDRTLGDADSSCCEDIEPRTVEVSFCFVIAADSEFRKLYLRRRNDL